jgi:hypothetical protein
MADEIIIETTSSQTLEVGTPGPQGPTGATGATGPQGPTIADENAASTNNILWQIRTTAFTAESGGRYVANGTFTVTNPASGNNGELFQVVVASGTVTVNGVAYGASRWPVTVARVAGAWTTLANTLTENLTLNGTNSTAPNQTSPSGSSLITRDLGDARFAPLLGLSTSNTVTKGTNGILFEGSYGVTNADNRIYGEWVVNIAANSSAQLDPVLDLNSQANWRGANYVFAPLVDSASVDYSASGIFTSAGIRRFQTTVGSGGRFYVAIPYPTITVNSALTVAAGDTITDDQGGSGIVQSASTGTTITLRWLNGTRNFTTSANVSVNGVSASRTVAGVVGMGGTPSGESNSILVYRGFDAGSVGGWSIWNNTTNARAVRFIFHR